ncbi:MAG: hypothetical protein ACE5IW_13985, partial [bacterium]
MDTKRLGIIFILVFLFVASFAFRIKPAHAEPYLAIRTGFKCSQCHVNRTGGGKRTDFGVIYSQTNLYIKFIRSSDKSSFFTGKLNESISVGANFRADDVSLFEFESSEGVKADFSNNSRISEANLYFQYD